MDIFKRICAFFMILLFIAAPPEVFASEAAEVHAAAHILIEAHDGRILSEHEAHRRMYPAATTMILTAILAYEHIGLDEILIAGNEVTMLPPGSARNFHEPGEAILGINLLRGMLIGSGNDTANIVVLEVARRASGNENMPFNQALLTFSNLMTQRARELGALDSNFVNPHGYHHDNHYTTAYDMAQIARHAMSIPTIAQIAGQATFSGPMAGDGIGVPDGALRLSRTWRSPNELIHMGEHHYPYAIGLRTGRTDHAGDSLVAAAARDGVTLISVTFNSPEIDYAPTRWQDNVNLFEFGFENFAHRTFLEANTVIGEMQIYDPQLDDDGILEFFSAVRGMLFLSREEAARLQREIAFEPDVVIYDEEYGQMFVAPVEEGAAIGNVSYTLDGEVVFTAAIYASRYVPLRTTASDIDFYMTRVNEIFFSTSSIPFWIAGVSVLILLIVLITMARNARKRKKSNYKYNWRY
ncbi:MAG: hypothetical protein FWC76_00450 [Defluviitaleaceae bacterium]|nr:hypothetical protein [Defluviitaleaceae bacterium]